MGWLGCAVGSIALVQGLAWLGKPGPRRLKGSLLAPAGLLVFALGLVAILIPEFFADGVGFDGN